MARVALILPATTYRAADFLDAARRLGADVIVASDHRSALAQQLGERVLRVDLDRPEAAGARIAALDGIAAVVGVDDQGVLAAAHAAAALGLPHNPLEAVGLTRDKAAMRQALAAAGVPQPAYRVLTPHADVAGLAAEVGLPCVLKPLSLSASRGVIRADTPHEAARAAERVRALPGLAADAPLLVERFVPGAEVAVEALLRGGRFQALAVFDKPDPLNGPYFEETLYVTPSRLPEATLAAITSAAADAARALALTEGPVHAELRITAEHQPVVLELAARSIGGLCARSLRFGLGTSLEEVILRHALGLPLHALVREGAAAGVLMLPIPRAGILHEVRGLDDARAVHGVEGVELTIPRGRHVQPLPEGDRYLGFAFARGRTPEEVEATLRKAHEMLTIVII